MPKRKDTLTGGTGDVNPQQFDLAITASAADTTTELNFPIPTYRLQNSSGRAWVMELLKVFWDLSLTVLAADGSYGTFASLATSPTITIGPIFAVKQLPQVVDWAQISEFVQFAAGSGTITSGTTIRPWIHDMTDGEGHGILIGTDRIFLRIQSTGTAQGVAMTGQATLYYRWKEVSLTEYIGIVQSQAG